jgi:multimeric flavodoxin WrbA
MPEIYGKMLSADVIVLASPVYYYTFNVQMKTVLDRTIAIAGKLNGKTVYLISAGQAPNETYMATMIDSFRKYIGCFKDGRRLCVRLRHG